MVSRQKILILGQEEIAALMSRQDYFDAVESAFARLASGEMRVPPVVHVPAPEGAFHIKSAGYFGDPSYVAVKVNGNFPGNPARAGLPTIQGAIVLCDGRNGALLAILDSIEVTAMRTAAASAVAARYLAQNNVETATVIGCGIQGRVQLLALADVLPLKTVFAFDTDCAKRDRFVEEMREETNLDVLPADQLDETSRASQVIVTCTSARRPFLGPEHVSPGTFIAAVGADNDDKQELYPALLGRSRVISDLTEQCATIGELHHALAARTMSRGDVVAELGAIVSGAANPDFFPEDIIVFDSTGLAIQDVAAAAMIYERARESGAGLPVALA